MRKNALMTCTSVINRLVLRIIYSKSNSMKWSFALLLICVSIFCSLYSFSQTVQFPEFNVSIFRHAEDQRYSDHKTIIYVADVDEALGTSLFPVKGKFKGFGKDKEENTYNVDSFRMSIARELTRSGIESQWSGTPDLNVVIIISSFSSSIINTGSFGDNTYNISGKAKVAVMNGKNELYTIKDVDLSQMVQYNVGKFIKNEFTNDLATPKAVENYTLVFNAVKKLALQAENSYMDSYKSRSIALSSVYRAHKKYPELTFFDSLNTRLTEELNKKSTKDYKDFIVPYEKEITTFMAKEFPKDYDAKDIKVAGYYDLAFLYYLAYDTVKLRQALDFLYENSTKFMGNRLQYNDRKPFQTEVNAYFSNLGVAKIRPDSTSGDVKSIFGGSEKSADGWMVLEKGDTLKGKHILRKLNGTIIDLDGSNKVLFEYTNEKGKTVRKSFKFGEIKTLSFNKHVYESHKFKPNMAQAGALSMDLLRTRDYMLEVVFASDKIKVFKDTYGDDPTNAILFARPGETELANQGKDWQKKRPEMMKDYFKDCATVVEALDKTSYDFKSDNGYLKLAQDYSSCK